MVAEDLNDQEDVESSEKDQVIPLKTLGLSAQARDSVVVTDEATVEVQPPPPGDIPTGGGGSEGPPGQPPPGEPPEGEPIPGREPLFDVKGTQVYASLITGDAPIWHLRVNGLALPLGVQAGMQGRLVQSLKEPLGEKLWQRLRDRLRNATRRRLEPNDPVHVPLDDDLGPVLLPNAPEVPREARWGPHVSPVRYQVMAVTAGGLEEVEAIAQVAAAVVEKAAYEGVWRLALPMLGTGAGQFRDQRTLVAEYMVRGVFDALYNLPIGTIGEITLTTRDEAALQEMRRKANALTNVLPQCLVSDEPRGQDLLGLQAEAGALAEALMLEGLEPPMAVGVLGGWGSGKTFVMRLMQRRMQEIRGYRARGWPLDLDDWPDRPYVGHVYLINFNAWTYAKSNLWASLMHEIFFKLNQQLTLEKQLVDALVKAEPRKEDWPDEEALRQEKWLEGNDLWPVLYAAGDEALNQLLETKAGEAVLEQWRAGEVAAERLWSYLQQRIETEMTILESKREELAKVRQELAARALWTPVGYKLQAVLSQWAWGKLEKKVGEEDAHTLKELEALRPDVLSLVKSAVERPVESLALLAFFAMAVAVPFLLEQLEPTEKLISWASGMLPVVVAVARAIASVQGKLNTIRAEYWSSVESERARLLAGETVFLDTDEMKELCSKVAQLEAEVREREEQAGLASRHRSLHEFVQSRLEDRYYEKQLGLMQQVESDLWELSEALYIRPDDQRRWAKLKREHFPRGQPRIVLFVDDLDRCPPQRVVEVLEAVQLLLKTRLFVVVLALDTRYVTRALEKAYEGILAAEGEPSGLDYIEKILTLPYRLRPIQRAEVPQYLRGQRLDILPPRDLEESAILPTPEDEVLAIDQGPGDYTPRVLVEEPDEEEEEPAPIAPEVVAFESAEFDAIESVCQEVLLTPRSLKRIINVMKLVKIFWHRTRVPSSPEKMQVIAALLALSARYPEVMRDAFSDLGLRYRDPGAVPQGLEESWHGVFEGFVSLHASRNQHVQVYGEEFMADVRATFSRDLRLDEIDAREFNLARSFSFVGDPAWSGEPTMKVELVDRKRESDLS